jgi:F0F1-type ATP synthase membrane subunit b/b'
MLKIPPDWGTFFALIVSFLVFWFIFKRLFFDPFLKLLEDRANRFKSLKARTEKLVQEAKAAEELRQQRLGSVRRQALAERETERRAAEEEAARITEEARAAARQSVEEVRAEIERQLRNAEQQLGELGENLAAELAERVLGRPLRIAGPQVHSDN